MVWFFIEKTVSAGRNLPGIITKEKGETMKKHIRRNLCVGILCGAMIFSSGCSLGNASEEPQTLEKGTLKVGMDLNIKPMCYLSEDTDQPAGFDVELAQAVAEGLDLKLEIIDTSQENLLKSLDADLYDCVISAAGLAQWNQTHYSHTRSYADLAPVKDKTEGESSYTKLAVFTKKGNSLKENLDQELEALLASGKVKEISEKYFEQDISAKAEQE